MFLCKPLTGRGFAGPNPGVSNVNLLQTNDLYATWTAGARRPPECRVPTKVDEMSRTHIRRPEPFEYSSHLGATNAATAKLMAVGFLELQTTTRKKAVSGT